MTRSENKRKKNQVKETKKKKKNHNFLVEENKMDLDAFKLIYIINVVSR